MTSKVTRSTASWLFLGFAVPVIVEILAALLIVSTEAGASAEGFSYLVVLVMLVIAIPVTLIGNAVLVPRRPADTRSFLLRSMALPMVFIGAALIYYTGIWDDFIDPLLPSRVEKVQTAGGGRLGDDTFESFYTVHRYTGSETDFGAIEDYAKNHFARESRECSLCMKMNMYYYYVPKELYDPIDRAVSREKAVAVYRYLGTEADATFQRVRP
jgi:hypothetical protein